MPDARCVWSGSQRVTLLLNNGKLLQTFLPEMCKQQFSSRMCDDLAGFGSFSQVGYVYANELVSITYRDLQTQSEQCKTDKKWQAPKETHQIRVERKVSCAQRLRHSALPNPLSESKTWIGYAVHDLPFESKNGNPEKSSHDRVKDRFVRSLPKIS
jgi:hypothetical protein